MFLKASAMESTGFFVIKEACKVSYAEIILWSIVVQEGTNLLNFYIFEYGAESSGESDAKQYFINKLGSRHGHKCRKKKVFSMMILTSINQDLNNI